MYEGVNWELLYRRAMATRTSDRAGDNGASPTAGDPTCAELHDDPERVREIRERLPDEETFQRMAETFKVLADPGRARLISTLLDAGELCVCDLAAATGLSETACSHNLRLLRSTRLVRYRKRGRNVYYALDDAHIRLLLDVALQHVGEDSAVED